VDADPILVVDDNVPNMKLLVAVLEGRGYPVRTALDAAEALAAIREARPRLILMDLDLPGMSGLELTRRLKEDPRYRGVLIIAVTASAMKGDEEAALEAGCDGYVTKPINTRTFPEMIAAYLNGRAPLCEQ
jgi:CheY-like chemotaxis protein